MRKENYLSSNQNATKFSLPAFKETSYGSKLQLDENTTMIVIAPHTNTAAGISEDKLYKGLRPHDGIKTEHVTLLGYADGNYNHLYHCNVLEYLFENKYGYKEKSWFRPGAEFYSVREDGSGFYHVLGNTSDRPILLLIRAEKMSVVIRSETERTPDA